MWCHRVASPRGQRVVSITVRAIFRVFGRCSCTDLHTQPPVTCPHLRVESLAICSSLTHRSVVQVFFEGNVHNDVSDGSQRISVLERCPTAVDFDLTLLPWAIKPISSKGTYKLTQLFGAADFGVRNKEISL